MYTGKELAVFLLENCSSSWNTLATHWTPHINVSVSKLYIGCNFKKVGNQIWIWCYVALGSTPTVGTPHIVCRALHGPKGCYVVTVHVKSLFRGWVGLRPYLAPVLEELFKELQTWGFTGGRGDSKFNNTHHCAITFLCKLSYRSDSLSGQIVNVSAFCLSIIRLPKYDF